MAATEGSYDDSTAARAPARAQLRGQRTAWLPRRADYTSETKPFFLTSEFLVFVLYLMGLGISASTDSTIDARLFWILVTVATFGYMVARGIAKSGSRSRAHDPREDIDLGGHRAAPPDPQLTSDLKSPARAAFSCGGRAGDALRSDWGGAPDLRGNGN
jgi:hypothetical protein